ncbi:MAG: tRNA (adenosine(37)-N6)-threonylcarbamoyltransferase complex dimerization subunit type 1 TsaB [Hyphomicrobiales bacterium]
MIVLAIETSMQPCSAAVLGAGGEGDGLFCERRENAIGNADGLMPMVERVMASAKMRYDRIGRIAVTTGPGTFTGIRVGIAAARSLALATGAGLVGIPSLEVIAQQLRQELRGERGVFAIACDARKGQVYVAAYGADGAVLLDPAVADPAAAAALIAAAGGPVFIAGSGARMVADAAPSMGFDVVPGDWLPDAGMLARMAAAREPSRTPVQPLYLRPPDARPQPDMALPRK